MCNEGYKYPYSSTRDLGGISRRRVEARDCGKSGASVARLTDDALIHGSCFCARSSVYVYAPTAPQVKKPNACGGGAGGGRGAVGSVRCERRGALTRSVTATSMIATRVIGCMAVDPEAGCSQRPTARAARAVAANRKAADTRMKKLRKSFRRASAAVRARQAPPSMASTRITARIFPRRSTRRWPE